MVGNTQWGWFSWMSPVQPCCHDDQTCLTVGFWFTSWMEKHCKNAPSTLLINLKVYKVKDSLTENRGVGFL